uniref:Uncharacterized protein n=1 Tax=Arion vulgaris TaxID=1028688 RepID=A0A0B6ZQA8_9EUPU
MSYTKMLMVTTTVVFSMLSIVNSLAVTDGGGTHNAERWNNIVNETKSGHHDVNPKPCCLPYKFKAVIVYLQSFDAKAKEVTMLYRDWENKRQIQENVVVDSHGVKTVVSQTYMDYKNMVKYDYAPGQPCQYSPLDHGMLEPCMPESATYLGKSYIGAYNDKTNFNSWYFRRTDLNRNVEITIFVTADECIPVSEHITGQFGAAKANTLLMFTNVTKDVDNSAFDIPVECLNIQDM